MGALLGSTIETGTNFGAIPNVYVQCVSQSSDLVEALYFTYFYIRAYIEEKGVEYVTYVSVYISRGIDAISWGPCWKIGKKPEEPSEAEIEAETLFAKKNKHFHRLK